MVSGNITHVIVNSSPQLKNFLDAGVQINTILLDFSKVFDKVLHQCLFLKLAHYGIRGPMLDWIKDFLTKGVARFIKVRRLKKIVS